MPLGFIQRPQCDQEFLVLGRLRLEGQEQALAVAQGAVFFRHPPQQIFQPPVDRLPTGDPIEYGTGFAVLLLAPLPDDVILEILQPAIVLADLDV